MGTWEPPDDLPDLPAAPESSEQPRERSWGSYAFTVLGVVLGTILVIGGLAAVATFVFAVVGLNHMGSNK